MSFGFGSPILHEFALSHITQLTLFAGYLPVRLESLKAGNTGGHKKGEPALSFGLHRSVNDSGDIMV
jgi:hypothetical protein